VATPRRAFFSDVSSAYVQRAPRAAENLEEAQISGGYRYALGHGNRS
jgi:hypothetical protein